MSQTKYLKGECRECGGHLEFPVETVGMTIDCPHCGKPTELLLRAPPEEPSVPRKAILWTVIAVVILGLGLAGAFWALNRAQKLASRQNAKGPGLQSAAADTNAVAEHLAAAVEQDPASKAGFRIGAIQLEKTSGSSVVHAVGTLTNPANRQRFGVKVEIDLLDSAGKKLGTATDYQSVIEPNGQWEFKALVVDAKSVSARLASISEDK